MAHVTTVEVDGVAVPMAARSPIPSRLTLRLRGVSTLTLSLVGYKLGQPDPYLGKPIVLKIDGTAVFAGDIVDKPVSFGRNGWGAVYQCRDLRARGDKMPMTDSNTLGAYASYNYDPEDPDKIDTRLGRTAGQIVADVLTMQANADGLASYGIGGYTSLSPPTLPAATLADLAAMDVIPPNPVQVGGDALLRGISAFLSQWAPNFALWVRPDGVIRFVDLRAPVESILTMGDCAQRVEPSGLSRSVAECYQRVLVRGKAVALPKLLTLANGGLEEWFQWGVLSNAAAKAAWTPDDFLSDQDARSIGSLTCTDLTHVVLTSDPGTQTWDANDWDQAHRKGTIFAWATVMTGYDRFATSRVVANAAKTSGSTSALTLETPLPDTNFDKYILRGLSSGASLVWRRYRAADATIRASLARRLTYPSPFVGASGAAASLTSYPTASVVWTLPGATLPNEFPDPIVDIDVVNGTFLLGTPTYNFNAAPPDDVRVLAAVNVSVLEAIRPATGYEGTSHAVEGLQDTLVITLDSWRDPVNQAATEAYAQDQLDSVKDAIIEGAVTVHDLYIPGLTFGLGLSIAGNGYDTDWESINAPVVETDVTWNSDGTGSHYTTTMQVSNRRASYATTAFLRPERKPADFAGGPTFSAPMPMLGGMEAGGAYQGGMDSGQPGGGMDMGGMGMPDASPMDEIGAMLNQDWSAPGGNTSGKYTERNVRQSKGYSHKKRPVRQSKPYNYNRTPLKSTTTKELAAQRAKAKAKNQAQAQRRIELGRKRRGETPPPTDDEESS